MSFDIKFFKNWNRFTIHKINRLYIHFSKRVYYWHFMHTHVHIRQRQTFSVDIFKYNIRPRGSPSFLQSRFIPKTWLMVERLKFCSKTNRYKKHFKCRRRKHIFINLYQIKYLNKKIPEMLYTYLSYDIIFLVLIISVNEPWRL